MVFVMKIISQMKRFASLRQLGLLGGFLSTRLQLQFIITGRFFWFFLVCNESSGEKVNELLILVGDKKKQTIFARKKLVFPIETLTPIHTIQKELESSKPMFHHMYHLVNV